MRIKVFVILAVTLLDVASGLSLLRGTPAGRCIFAKFAEDRHAPLIDVRQQETAYCPVSDGKSGGRDVCYVARYDHPTPRSGILAEVFELFLTRQWSFGRLHQREQLYRDRTLPWLSSPPCAARAALGFEWLTKKFQVYFSNAAVPPTCCTLRAPAITPASAHERKFPPLRNSMRKPALKLSPAPVVSITFAGMAGTSKPVVSVAM